ncbi:conjugal transfer protein TraL [uncultured Desulfovibrio sp.]|uniref:nucleotide-binding protein n=1 Tax=uncultured Desulfovibrio sp. TaxID=167968 RepID=UPI0025842743|nr:conjugal transfer protein TraL [uncultured Desulfovibrio sp.]
MATIHFILQGKGGVGKSMIAVMLYQALGHFGKDVTAYDTDPVNATLTSFKEFNVTSLDVMKDGNIDPRKFDVLLEALVNAPEESHVIVDNGASSFIALGAYLSENDFLPLLEEQGHRVFFHSIVTGGQALGDTIQGLARMALGFPASPIVVWLNPFFGDIAIDGKGFEEFKIYKDYSSQFHALIELPLGNKALIGKDLEELFAKRQSFEAGINGSSTSIAVKARLRRYWNQILSCVEQADIL